MSSSLRPRRTRIYGANYDLSENYYKRQLQDLDRKRGIGRASTPLYAPTHYADDFNYREPSISRPDFSEERNSVFPKRALSFDPTSDIFDDEYGSSSLSKRVSSVKFGLSDDSDFGTFKPRSARKHLDALDFDNDEGFGSFKSRNTKKRLDAYDVDKEASDGYVSRRLKIKTGILKEEHGAEAEEASLRMKATKSRLADLESEMMDMSLKHTEREKRNHDLKRLLNDCDAIKEIEF